MIDHFRYVTVQIHIIVHVCLCLIIKTFTSIFFSQNANLNKIGLTIHATKSITSAPTYISPPPSMLTKYRRLQPLLVFQKNNENTKFVYSIIQYVYMILTYRLHRQSRRYWRHWFHWIPRRARRQR